MRVTDLVGTIALSTCGWVSQTKLLAIVTVRKMSSINTITQPDGCFVEVQCK